MYEIVEVYLHTFLNLALDAGELLASSSHPMNHHESVRKQWTTIKTTALATKQPTNQTTEELFKSKWKEINLWLIC